MLNEAVREKIESKMTALFDEVKKSYLARHCGYPYIPIVRESFLAGPRTLVCGKGGGSWGPSVRRSRPYSSTMGITFNLRPSYVASIAKS